MSVDTELLAQARALLHTVNMVDRLERIVIMLQTHVRKVSAQRKNERTTLVQTTHELKGEQRTADAVAKQLMQWTNSIETQMKSRHHRTALWLQSCAEITPQQSLYELAVEMHECGRTQTSDAQVSVIND